MKKIILSLSLFATTAIALAASDPVVDPEIKQKFKKEFASAENVKWSEQDNYLAVSFTIAQTRTMAIYSKSGELISTIRDILFDQLPLSVITGLNKAFPDATVSSVKEVTNDLGTTYKMNAETKELSLKLSADSYGNIFTEEKNKK